MAHTKVLLREDVDDLGARGEIVRVRAGYARNYLLPRNLAVEATTGNVKGIEAGTSGAAEEGSERARHRRGQSQQMSSLELEFRRKAGEQGALVWLCHVDGRCRGFDRAWLRDRSSSHSPA